MSTALRIAAVTQVLKDLLNDGLINNDVSGITQNNITVSSLPPDRIAVDNGSELSQLNIFMYQATYNQGWRNVAQPSFNTSGERIANPPLALDLHYLLTAYGASELHTDILLGMGMKFFHETPVLGREQITQATGSINVSDPNNRLPDSLQFLSQANLADQVEQVKISPEVLGLEDISKLWAAFGTKYRPTATYKATVVLIESEKAFKAGPPVSERKIYVEQINIPVIEKVLSQSLPGQPVVEGQKILNGYRLILRGYNLMNDLVELNVDGNTVDAATTNQVKSNTEMSFIIPDAMAAGLHEIKVVHPLEMGVPPVQRKWVYSKPKIFSISPAIQATPAVTNVITTNGLISATIIVQVVPSIQPGQKVQLLLHEMVSNVSPQFYTFSMNESVFGNPAQPIVAARVDIEGVKPGTYKVRLQVAEAEAELKPGEAGITPIITI